MSSIKSALFNLLLNSLLQIGFFGILARAFSPLVAKARAKHQYAFYVAVLLVGLAAPVINTLWYPSAPVPAEITGPSARVATSAVHLLWSWHNDAQQHGTLTSVRALQEPVLQGWVVGVWATFVLFQLVRHMHAVGRLRRIRNEASDLSPQQAALVRGAVALKPTINILQSKSIHDPVTIGVFRPVILLPAKVLPGLGQEEISAIVAHEYGHIRRKDFATHMICEFLSLPVAWHPGIAYLRSKILQTRELACDEYAAKCLGNRRSYAKRLLRIASLCLHTARLNAAGVGFVDGDDLEARIAALTGKTLDLTRAGLAGIALVTSLTFGAGAVVAHALSFQVSAGPANAADKFVGTWHWMFKSRSFVTMVLSSDRDHLTGTVTGSRITLNQHGELTRADPAEDLTPNPITKTTREGSVLRITVTDGGQPFEFVMKLKDATHAEIHPEKAPANMKAIQAEKAL